MLSTSLLIGVLVIVHQIKAEGIHYPLLRPHVSSPLSLDSISSVTFHGLSCWYSSISVLSTTCMKELV